MEPTAETDAADFDQWNRALSSHFTSFELYAIDGDAVWADFETQGGDVVVELALEVDAHPEWNFSMTEQSLFADDFEAYEVGPGNVVRKALYPEIHAMAGVMKNADGRVAMVLTRELDSDRKYFSAEIFRNGTVVGIEPAFRYALDAPANLYVVYHESAQIINETTLCDQEAQPKIPGAPNGENGEVSANKAAATCTIGEVSALGDYPLYTAQGSNSSSTFSWMADRIYYASRRYWGYNDYPINLKKKSTYLYTSNVTVSSNTADKAAYLDDWKAFGNNNSGWYNRGDMNVLFTGNNVSGVAGRAKSDNMCSTSNGSKAYCFVENYGGATGNNLTAHECGHIWWCDHEPGFMASSLSSQTSSMHEFTEDDLNVWAWFGPDGCVHTATCVY